MSNYTTIRSSSQLREGDHISWPTQELGGMLSHHAIVVAVLGGDKFSVVHVSRTGRDGQTKSSAADSLSLDGNPDSHEVCECTKDLGEWVRNKELCRYDYESTECYEPAEVIENARSKIGKFAYNLLTDNCEHFARWCKTGKYVSYQAHVPQRVINAVEIIEEYID